MSTKRPVMSTKRPVSLLIAVTAAIYFPRIAAAEPAAIAPETAAELAEKHMPEDRDVPSMYQDDHIHTRPDVPTAIFEGLDTDDDEYLQWSEVQPLEMTREEFRAIDADGSGALGIEEYIAISPKSGNDYQQ